MSRARTALFLATLLGVSACTSTAPPPEEDDGRPPTSVLFGENLELFPGTAGATRVGFHSAESSAQVIVRFEPEDARVGLCPLADIDGPIDESRCRNDVATGVRQPVSGTGMEGIAIVVTGAASVRADIVVEFAEALVGARRLVIAMPRMRAPLTGPCEDNACNPFFELTPTAAGPFEARATWTGPDGSLVLLSGRVRGRSLTATGVPYSEPARVDGPSPAAISTTLSAPAEYALVFRHADLRPGRDPLEDVRIEAVFPQESN